jgi:hypothetical protein
VRYKSVFVYGSGSINALGLAYSPAADTTGVDVAALTALAERVVLGGSANDHVLGRRLVELAVIDKGVIGAFIGLAPGIHGIHALGVNLSATAIFVVTVTLGTVLEVPSLAFAVGLGIVHLWLAPLCLSTADLSAVGGKVDLEYARSDGQWVSEWAVG